MFVKEKVDDKDSINDINSKPNGKMNDNLQVSNQNTSTNHSVNEKDVNINLLSSIKDDKMSSISEPTSFFILSHEYPI